MLRWGGRRTAQDALVELLEEAGLPPVCVADALEEELDMPLGAVLAAAVQVGDRVLCSLSALSPPSWLLIAALLGSLREMTSESVEDRNQAAISPSCFTSPAVTEAVMLVSPSDPLGSAHLLCRGMQQTEPSAFKVRVAVVV